MTETPEQETIVAGARRIAAAAQRYLEPDGIAEMAERRFVTGSVHRSVILDVLHDAQEQEGIDPMRMLKCVLLGLSSEQADETTRKTTAELLRTIDRNASSTSA